MVDPGWTVLPDAGSEFLSRLGWSPALTTDCSFGSLHSPALAWLLSSPE